MVHVMYRTASTYLVFLLTQTFTAFGDAPTIVESVRPTESFHHEIEVKLVGDQDFRTITIAGPRFWCRLPQATPDVNSKTSSTVIYNWYKMWSEDVAFNNKFIAKKSLKLHLNL